METTTPDDSILSTHKYRWAARLRERRIQWLIDNWYDIEQSAPQEGYPPWMRGVKVVPAGDRQFAVVATRNRGH